MNRDELYNDEMSDSDVTNSVMSDDEMNQEGGRRHRRNRSHKHSKKSHRGSKSKRRHGNKTQKRRKTMRKHNKKQKGGFLTGAMSAARQALLPLLMFGAQKHQQTRMRERKQKK
jgi:hypothetical protein